MVLTVALIITTGCGGEKKPAPEQQQKKGPKIGVSIADMQRNGNQTMKQVIDEAGKKDKAKITWLDAKGDPVQQQKDIQKLIEEKVKVVILQVTDPTIGSELVRLLTQNNIKVIALETLPDNTPVDGYITSDHSRTGSLQVRYLETLLQQAQQQVKQGQVMLTPQTPQQGGQQDQQGQQGQQNQQSQQGDQQGQQQQGQQQQQQMVIPDEQQIAMGIQDGGPIKVVVLEGDSNDQMARAITGAVTTALQKIEKIDVVLSQPHPRWDANAAKATMQQVLSTNKDIDAVLANDSNLAMAAVEVLKQFGMERRVVTIGAGADPKAVQALTSGEHDAEVDNRPDLLAGLAYQAATDLADEKPFDYDTRIDNGDYTVPAKIVPPRLIQQDNAYLLEERMKKQKDKQKQQEQDQQQQGQQQQGQEQQQQGQQQGQQQQSQQQGQGQQQAGQQQQGQAQKTTLKITTNEGKVVEVQIDGEVQTIESQAGGQQGQQGQQEQQGQQQGSQ